MRCGLHCGASPPNGFHLLRPLTSRPLHGLNVPHLPSACVRNGRRPSITAELFRMAGACCKCPVSLFVFKRSLSVAPRSSGSAPRCVLPGWRRGERGLQEGCWAARPPCAFRPLSSYRHPAFLCFSCQESMSESLRTCYVYLNQTSRSFAAVIQALDGELR